MEKSVSLPLWKSPCKNGPIFQANHLLRAKEFNTHGAFIVIQKEQVMKLVRVPLKKTTQGQWQLLLAHSGHH